MRPKAHPALYCAALYLVHLAIVFLSASQLPASVTTHFDGAGLPNGWETRESWRNASLLLGTALPACGLLLFWAIRFLPAITFNLPNRDYWLGVDRRGETFALFLRLGWWLGCLELAFVIGVEWAVWRANTIAPPHLSSLAIWPIAGCFLAGLLWWIITLRGHFKMPA